MSDNSGQWFQLIGGGIGGTGLTVFTSWLIARSSTRQKAKEAAALAAQSKYSENLELTKYIQSLVNDALEEPERKIKELETEVGRLVKRESTMKNVLRRYFQRLLWWDERGRPGSMPMPSPEDMLILDLSDLDTDTRTRAEIDALLTTPTEERP